MLFDFLAAFLAKASLALGGSLLARYTLLRKLPAASRHRLGVAAFLCLPLLAALSLPLGRSEARTRSSEEEPIPVPTADADMVKPDRLSSELAIAVAPTRAMPETENDRAAYELPVPAPIANAIAALWLTGVVAALGMLAYGRAASAMALRKLRPCRDRGWIAALASAERAAGHRQSFRFLLDPKRPPYSAGIVRKTVAVPPASSRWNPERRRAALLHELAHLSRRDGLWALACELFACLAWCVPFSRPLLRANALDREEACDAAAIESGQDPVSLARLLLDLSADPRVRPLPSALGVAGRKDIERRIMMLLKRNQESRPKAGSASAKILTACLFLFLAALALTAAAAAPPVFAESASSSATLDGARSAAGSAPATAAKTIRLAAFGEGDAATSELEFDSAALPLSLPTDSAEAKVTMGFGANENPFTGEWFVHVAVDLMLPWGTPVKSTIAGTVAESGFDQKRGEYVVVSDGKVAVMYAHLQDRAVSAGKSVALGDAVGRVGTSGQSTGPHLHYELRVLSADGSFRWVDPAPLLRLAGAKYRNL